MGTIIAVTEKMRCEMKKLSLRMRSLAVVGTLLLIGPTLTGCETLAGINGSVESSKGSVSLGDELPAGWPKEVPVVDGEVTFGAGSTNEKDTWVVTITPTSSNALADAQADLEDAGFTLDAGVTVSEGNKGAFTMTSSDYKVAVVGNGTDLVYTVTPAT
jgi:hypothetical protein